ncbi:MAG: AAA family ATPase [Candidatus Omnitrophota bacterium]
MKILSITVKNVRGLVDFTFEPKGKSVVVSGPNGSGKSALVDSLDFLFTGRIQRLEGEGTGDVSLRDQGPHIDHKPAEAVVSAEVLEDGHKFRIERIISTPKILKCEPQPDVSMTVALEIAKRGYHVLSRREILRYIAAEPSERAKSIQALMNVSEIEDLRKLLNGVQNEIERAEIESLRNLGIFQADIVGLLGLKSFDDAGVLSAVNALRATLKGAPIESSALDVPKRDLIAPASSSSQAANPVIVADDIKKVTFDDKMKASLKIAEAGLNALVLETEKDPALRKDLDSKELIDLGLSLIGSGEKCPLCEKPWEAGKLRKFLEDKQKKAEKAAELQKKASGFSDQIIRLLGSFEAVLPRLSAASEKLGLVDSKKYMDDTAASWATWRKRLANPLSEYPSKDSESVQAAFFSSGDLSRHLSTISNASVVGAASVSPEQVAWDTLTKFEAQWPSLVRHGKESRALASKKDLAGELARQFQKSRDAVMAGLYSTIERSFVKYYCALHDHEKETFTASLRPDGAALKLEVDFHGKGKFPPIAFHSEGHQDSMGLCLYLALMEKLTQGKIGFTILDDVVMSVDSGHRQPVCELLVTEFSDRQFFITTHDKIWARQLRNANVVPVENFLTFRAWTVADGPKWREEDRWREISDFLAAEDVPKAAAALRRELEEFFDDVCDSLVALVPYNGDGRYELSDLMDSALIKLDRLLGNAKKAANSWNHPERIKEYEEIEARFIAAKKASKIEQWILNLTVHYNRLYQATPADFAPIFAGFSQLREAYMCPKCRSLIYVSPRKPQEAVRCRCSLINWNLIEKTREDAKRDGDVATVVPLKT